MLRTIILSAVILSAFLFQAAILSAKETPLISRQMVEPYGLTRAWFSQVDIDPAHSKVLHAIVEGGEMYIITDDAVIHALDAETGQLLWGRSLGNREMLFQEPTVNSRMVFAMNGTELFILDRRNGKLLQHIPLPGAASTACEASENYVYVPMINRRIIAYPLIDATPKEDAEGTDSNEANTQPHAEQQGVEEPQAATGGDYNDPVLDSMVKRFAEAKAAVMAEAAPPKKEKPIVLKAALGIPMTNLSFGTIMVKPLLSSQYAVYNAQTKNTDHRENIIWVTEKGFLVAAGIDSLSTERFDLLYKIDSASQSYYLSSDRIARRDWPSAKKLNARPTVNQCIPAFYTASSQDDVQIPSMVLVGGTAYVFAISDRRGEVAWQFSASGPVNEPIAVIGTEVFCCTTTGGMHALNLLDGKEKWYTPDIKQFIAASKQRLYTLDRKGRLVILDRNSGAVLNSFDARRFDKFLFNLQNDRIYVVNETGLIQCLHERQPQTLDNILASSDNPATWHRLTCKEYADVMRGKAAPVLYWQDSVEHLAAGKEKSAADADRPDTTNVSEDVEAELEEENEEDTEPGLFD